MLLSFDIVQFPSEGSLQQVIHSTEIVSNDSNNYTWQMLLKSVIVSQRKKEYERYISFIKLSNIHIWLKNPISLVLHVQG